MSELKLKLKWDSWFYSHLGHRLPGGNCRRSLPQVFACYLFTMNNFSHLYRNSTMSKFKFFMERVDRWGDSMQALWGSLGICPPHKPYRSSLPHSRRITFHQLPQGLGRCPKTTSLYGLSLSTSWWHLWSWNLQHGHSMDKFTPG